MDGVFLGVKITIFLGKITIFLGKITILLGKIRNFSGLLIPTINHGMVTGDGFGPENVG